MGAWDRRSPLGSRRTVQVVVDAGGQLAVGGVPGGDSPSGTRIRLVSRRQLARGRLLGAVCQAFGHRLGVVDVMEGTLVTTSDAMAGVPNTVALEFEPGVRSVAVLEARQRTGCRVCGAVMGERADPDLGSTPVRDSSLALLDTAPLVEAGYDLGRQGPQPARELSGDRAGPGRLDGPDRARPASALRTLRFRGRAGFGVNGYTFVCLALGFVPLIVVASAPLWVGMLSVAAWLGVFATSIVVASRDVVRDERYATVWDYPAVETLVRAYLTSEWLGEYADVWAAVDDFLANDPSAARLPAELARLVGAPLSEQDLRAYVVDTLGSAYLPEKDGLTLRSWLVAAEERARRRLDT